MAKVADSAAARPAAPGDELGLTSREREALALVAEGRTNRQIAEAAATVHRLGLTS